MDEQPYLPQQHNRWGFAIGQYTPPPGTPPRAPAPRPPAATRAPLERRPFVACAPLLTSGFVLWVVAYLLGRWSSHQAAAHAATGDGAGGTGTTAGVLALLCVVVGAGLLATGICFLGHHVDTLARAHRETPPTAAAPTT